MENFTDLKSLCNHLEENATDYKYSHQIGNLFQKLSDLKHKETKSDEAEKAQWEVDFFYFMIEEGKCKPIFPGTLDRFDDRVCEYLIGRLDSTNPLLKARYSHILWCSQKKHAKYAKMAVDSYLKLIKIYEAKDMKEPQEHYGLDVLEVIKNAYSVAHQIKYRVDNIKSELRRLVNTFNFKSSFSFALRANLIKMMLKDKKRFCKKDFLGFENICWQISESLTKSGNIHNAIDMLELGEKVEQKLGKKTYDWRKQVAESYETLMNRAEKDNNLTSLTFCQSALENYKKLKDKNKINELEKKYSELKNSMKIPEFKAEVDLAEHIKRCREFAQKVVQNDPDKIIEVLMLDKNLLPRYKDMEKIAEEHSKKFIAQHLLSIVRLDQSGHQAQHFSDEDEKKYYGIVRQYKWELELNKIYLINGIFFAAIQENKLSADIL